MGGGKKCYPGSEVLINKYNIRDKELLEKFEIQKVVVKLLGLDVNPARIGYSYDLVHLVNIHKYLFKDIFCIDYNFASLLLTLLIIYQEIKLYKVESEFINLNPKWEIILGILAGLAIITKQTSGLLICIALLGNKLLVDNELFARIISDFCYFSIDNKQMIDNKMINEIEVNNYMNNKIPSCLSEKAFQKNKK